MVEHDVRGISPDRASGGRDPLIEVDGLSVYLPTRHGGEVQILDDVSFSISKGETLGVIGESGSGKSMTALSIIGLLPPGARVDGHVRLGGVELLRLSDKSMNKIRGNQISMIFQEPMTALDPVFTIGYQISQTLRAHQDVSRRDARTAAIDMLAAVGIPDPVRRFGEYPHQLSGGMRQRAMIAMALICEPKLLIADEPTTAVDITIQAQLLELLQQLNEERDTAILFISHDVGVIAEMCREVVVMYAGQVIERADVDDLLERPAHPYASGLLWAVPRTGVARHEELYAIKGRVPVPTDIPSGCRFHPRCDHATPSCAANQQVLAPFATAGRAVRCERADELTLAGVPETVDEATRGGAG